MTAPQSTVQRLELQAIDKVGSTLTRPMNRAFGRQRTNVGQIGKKMIRVGIFAPSDMGYVKDPHSNKSRVGFLNHPVLISRYYDFIDFYQKRGYLLSWIMNALKSFDDAAMFAKYATLRGIEHPQVFGYLSNIHHSVQFRNAARKNPLAVPIYSMFPTIDPKPNFGGLLLY